MIDIKKLHQMQEEAEQQQHLAQSWLRAKWQTTTTQQSAIGENNLKICK